MNAPRRESPWGISGSGRGLGEICLKTAYPKESGESNQIPSKQLKVFFIFQMLCEKVTVCSGISVIIQIKKGKHSQSLQ